MTHRQAITINSSTTRFSELAECIHDALYEAQHSAVGLRGAEPNLTVLISRNLLKLEDASTSKAMRLLSAELQKQCVVHSFLRVALGTPEPKAHEVRISLE